MFDQKTKILIVDDMPTLRDLLTSQLKALRFSNLLTAKDGVEAWALLNQEHQNNQPIGLVISDWNMPNMHGIELLSKVRNSEEFKELPFILLTSQSEGSKVTEAVVLGVSQYILKPFTGKGFSEKLEAAWLKHQKK